MDVCGDFRKLVIGKEECKIATVVDIMLKGPIASHVGRQWRDLARQLLIDTIRMDKLASDINLDKIQISDIFHEILCAWVLTHGKAATLGALIDHLTILNWTNVYENLSSKFFCPEQIPPLHCAVVENSGISLCDSARKLPQDFQIKKQPVTSNVEEVSITVAEGLAGHTIRSRVQELPSPGLLIIRKNNNVLELNQSRNALMSPMTYRHVSYLVSDDRYCDVMKALGKSSCAKILFLGSILVPSLDNANWDIQIFNEPTCLVKDDLENVHFIQAFNSKDKKFDYRRKVTKDFNYELPKPGFLAFEDDDGCPVGVLFTNITESHLFSETLKIILGELQKDSGSGVGSEILKLETIPIPQVLTCPPTPQSIHGVEEKNPAAKDVCFEESAVFKEINNDMKNLAILFDYSLADLRWIWNYHFKNVRGKIEAGECICETISQVKWGKIRRFWFFTRTYHECFKPKYEGILKRTVQAFNEHRESANQDCFCKRVLKKAESRKHFEHVLNEAPYDMIYANGNILTIFEEIAESRRDFFKDNLEKNICICSTFHCPDRKFVSERYGRDFTDSSKQKYDSIFNGLTEEFNKHHDKGNQDCFCRTMTRPLLVELRLSKSKKGLAILKEIAELKASTIKTLKIFKIFPKEQHYWDFVEKLAKENCMCKTLFSWIWDEEICKQSPRINRDALFKSTFETTFQRAVQEFNELRDEASEDCFCRTLTGVQEEKYVHMTLQSRANSMIHDYYYYTVRNLVTVTGSFLNVKGG